QNARKGPQTRRYNLDRTVIEPTTIRMFKGVLAMQHPTLSYLIWFLMTRSMTRYAAKLAP
ncbi:MAG: hypothetical protein ACOX87_02785, partial [Chloroflexota bacterium]